VNYGAPEVNDVAVELHVHLVEVSSPMSEAAHARDALPANVASEHRTGSVPPLPHGLVADVDAALEQQVFDVSQR